MHRSSREVQQDSKNYDSEQELGQRLYQQVSIHLLLIIGLFYLLRQAGFLAQCKFIKHFVYLYQFAYIINGISSNYIVPNVVLPLIHSNKEHEFLFIRAHRNDATDSTDFSF